MDQNYRNHLQKLSSRRRLSLNILRLSSSSSTLRHPNQRSQTISFYRARKINLIFGCCSFLYNFLTLFVVVLVLLIYQEFIIQLFLDQLYIVDRMRNISYILFTIVVLVSCFSNIVVDAQAKVSGNSSIKYLSYEMF